MLWMIIANDQKSPANNIPGTQESFSYGNQISECMHSGQAVDKI